MYDLVRKGKVERHARGIYAASNHPHTAEHALAQVANYRATRDLDLLRSGDDSFTAIRTDIATICSAEVEPDAVLFDPSALQIEAIRAEDEYAGTRVTLPTRCGTARLTLEIDMGRGDSVWPPPQPCAYPALLDFPPPRSSRTHRRP